MIAPYPVEVDLELTVEILDATRGHRGSEWSEPEPDSVTLRVLLGVLDVTAALPGDVLADLEADALERLADAAEP